MKQIVQIFKALGDETRLKILIILFRRKICAKGIAKHLDISEAAVSQHIKVLKEAGIIVGEKVGYFVHYDLQEVALQEIVEFIEQMNNEHTINSCKLGIHMPNECKASCKANKNKCCHRNK
ncbi:ArsR/SmtB family transcription factor [Natronincola ferrireducens]|uniref:ArsR family transcriptional regulator n=1 Tax=Natronincola ferrireducens TaxID=393762 RepID=A0A1G9FSL0_9FIRM|nr:metalloregulator ArsR/SmtB family transcription factor [Natronincola ferrireducens]SDK91394.1 ArsR family transcriptional regulator [Natronincola ferrireducens]